MGGGGRVARHHGGSRPGVVSGRGEAGGEQRLGAPGDGVVVLAMDGDEAPERAGGGEHAEELAIVQAQRIVGEEHLEAADPAGDDARQFGEHLVRRVGDDLVERVVDHGLAGAAAIFVERGPDRVALELGREADDRGRAAGEGRAAAGFPGFLVGAAAFLQLLDMAMAVDAAGQDEQAAGVEGAGALQPLP